MSFHMPLIKLLILATNTSCSFYILFSIRFRIFFYASGYADVFDGSSVGRIQR